MGLENLFQGLQMFQQGLKEFSTSRAIGQATDAVKQLNESELSDQQKRVAQMQLGNQLAAHLSQLGATGAQIEGATGAIKPQQYASVQDLFLQGKLTGNDSLVKEAEQLQQFTTAPTLAAEARAFERQKYLKRMDIDAEMNKTMLTAGLKSRGEAAKAPVLGWEPTDQAIKLPESEATKLREGNDKLKNMMNIINKLDSMVDEEGTESFSVFSNKSSRMSALYGKLMLEAKDAFRLGVLQKIDEDKMKEIFPDPTAFFGTGRKYKAQSTAVREMLKEDMMGAAQSRGYNVSPKYLENIGLQTAAPGGSGLQAGERVVQRPDPKQPGKTIPVVYDAAGNPLRVWTGAE